MQSQAAKDLDQNVLDNECKQTENKKRKSAETSNLSSKTAKSNKKDKNNLVSVKFLEEGDVAEFEVDGQSTEFNSEIEFEEEGEINNSSDSELEEESQRDTQEFSRNNNAMECGGEKIKSSLAKRSEVAHNNSVHYDDDTNFESDVVIGSVDQEKVQQQEEKEMQHFVDFLKKQGMVMVQTIPEKVGKTTTENVAGTLQSVNRMPKKTTKLSQKSERNLDDNSSVVTVYRNAVPQLVTPVQVLNSKRDSSSSEEAMDTSNKLDELNVEPMSVKNNVNHFIAGVLANQDKTFGCQYMVDNEEP